MKFEKSKYRIVRASDVSDRDGIGVEFWIEDSMIAEIFRDDAKKHRTVWLKDSITLEEMEWFVSVFKEEIPWEFMD